MLINKVFRCRGLAMTVLAAFVLMATPVWEFAQGRASAPGGALVGFIFDKDMKTPVMNAVVKLRDVSRAREYESTPSDANGMYRITGIGEGRYILGVTALAKGDYNFDYVLALRANETAKLSVALIEGGGPAAGTEAKKKSFFTSPMGIVAIVLVAGAVLYTVFKSDEEASPVR